MTEFLKTILEPKPVKGVNKAVKEACKCVFNELSKDQLVFNMYGRPDFAHNDLPIIGGK